MDVSGWASRENAIEALPLRGVELNAFVSEREVMDRARAPEPSGRKKEKKRKLLTTTRPLCPSA